MDDLTKQEVETLLRMTDGMESYLAVVGRGSCATYRYEFVSGRLVVSSDEKGDVTMGAATSPDAKRLADLRHIRRLMHDLEKPRPNYGIAPSVGDCCDYFIARKREDSSIITAYSLSEEFLRECLDSGNHPYDVMSKYGSRIHSLFVEVGQLNRYLPDTYSVALAFNDDGRTTFIQNGDRAPIITEILDAEYLSESETFDNIHIISTSQIDKILLLLNDDAVKCIYLLRFDKETRKNQIVNTYSGKAN